MAFKLTASLCLLLFALVGCGDAHGDCPPGDASCTLTSAHIPCVAPPLDCPAGQFAVAYHLCGLAGRDERGRATTADGLHGTDWLMPAGTPPAAGCALMAEWCHPTEADSAEHSSYDLSSWRGVATVGRSWESLDTAQRLAGWNQQDDDEVIGFSCCRERPEWVVTRSTTSLDANGVRIPETRSQLRWTCPGPPPPEGFERPLPPPLVLP